MKSKKKYTKMFDPNSERQSGNLFGLPFDQHTSEIIVIPVPWDVTSSHQEGISLGPKAILKASSKIDLFDPHIHDAWKLGLSMLPIDDKWIEKNNQAKKYAVEYINFLKKGSTQLSDEEIDHILFNINVLSEKINEWVYAKSNEIINNGKIPVVLGGDHSSSYGLIKAIAEKHSDFGVLHIGSHADLKPAFEGFTYSYASIMYNTLKIDSVSKLVQVGIRDFCEKEYALIEKDHRISAFYDEVLAKERFEGITWSQQVNRIIGALPDKIYISLDVDVFEQRVCDLHGTLTQDGLSYNQLLYLFEKIIESGKKIISFDICGISGNKNDGSIILGARLLYTLANVTAVTHKLLKYS